MREAWARYKPTQQTSGARSQGNRPSHTSTHGTVHADTRNLFASISGMTSVPGSDALEEYLKTDVIPHVYEDPLPYWSAILNSQPDGLESTALARMALDYLSIPGIFQFNSEVRPYADCMH